MVMLNILLFLFYVTAISADFVEVEAHTFRNISGIYETFQSLWQQDHDATPPEVFGYAGFDCPIDTDRLAMIRGAESIDEVRPENVGIIAAMGDSLTAGSGANGSELADIYLQYRGISFSIGGEGTLDNTLTLANIFRKYNKHIIGASFGISTGDLKPNSMLNVAIPGARAKDMPDQARELVKRVKKIPLQERLWKVVTIFVGANDVCAACTDKKPLDRQLEDWAKDIRKSLNILHRRLKRTFVNLVTLVPIFQLRQFETVTGCKALHFVECPCISFYKNHDEVDNLNRKYQQFMNSMSDGYDRSDFAVVVQPCVTDVQIPISSITGNPDLSYFGPDCFHFSRRTHAAIAAALWNNMFEPVGQKTTKSDPSRVVLNCPDAEVPFLRTPGNSIGSLNETFHGNLRMQNVHGGNDSILSIINRVNDDYVDEQQPINSRQSFNVIFAVVTVTIITSTLTIMFCWIKRQHMKLTSVNERTPLLAMYER